MASLRINKFTVFVESVLSAILISYLIAISILQTAIFVTGTERIACSETADFVTVFIECFNRFSCLLIKERTVFAFNKISLIDRITIFIIKLVAVLIRKISFVIDLEIITVSILEGVAIFILESGIISLGQTLICRICICIFCNIKRIIARIIVCHCIGNIFLGIARSFIQIIFYAKSFCSTIKCTISCCQTKTCGCCCCSHKSSALSVQIRCRRIRTEKLINKFSYTIRCC